MKKKVSKAGPQVEERPVDRHFVAMNQLSLHPTNRVLQLVFLPLVFLSFLGLIWMIPFPEIAFLKKHGYHIFLNWASFFIAGIIYYYLRLAPTLSYAVLFSIGVFSYVIVQLEYLEQRGGPAVWVICLIALLISLFILWWGQTLEQRKASAAALFRSVLHGPIWVWHFAFLKLKIPY